MATPPKTHTEGFFGRGHPLIPIPMIISILIIPCRSSSFNSFSLYVFLLVHLLSNIRWPRFGAPHSVGMWERVFGPS